MSSDAPPAKKAKKVPKVPKAPSRFQVVNVENVVQRLREIGYEVDQHQRLVDNIDIMSKKQVELSMQVAQNQLALDLFTEYYRLQFKSANDAIRYNKRVREELQEKFESKTI